MAIIKNWAVKKDGRQVKKTFTGKWLNGSPVVKISGQLTLVCTTTVPDLLPLTLLDLLKEAGAPAVGDTYTEGSAWVERTFYADATPRFIGPRGNAWEWEILYTIGGVYVDAPQQPNNTGGEDANETLLTFSTSVELEDYAAAADLNGQWNCNSLGEFFADPIVFKSGILNMIYNYREYSNPLELSKNYFQCLNNAAWYGFPAGTVKCADISFNATQTTSGTEYNTTYKLQYRPRGWAISKANAGFYYNNSGTITRALNADGSPTNEPVLLALDGSKLASGAAPIVKDFAIFPTADFSGLDLPNPFTL